MPNKELERYDELIGVKTESYRYPHLWTPELIIEYQSRKYKLEQDLEKAKDIAICETCDLPRDIAEFHSNKECVPCLNQRELEQQNKKLTDEVKQLQEEKTITENFNKLRDEQYNKIKSERDNLKEKIEKIKTVINSSNKDIFPIFEIQEILGVKE